jgi:hypothetical protein
MTTQFYFFSRLQFILSQIRRKDEIRLGAVFCHGSVAVTAVLEMKAAGSTDCTV